MTAWWYWTLFAVVAVAMLVAVPLMVISERRNDDRDAEEWGRMPGAVPSTRRSKQHGGVW